MPDIPQVESNSVSDNLQRSNKSAITALLLCIFLGVFGIHRFYAGRFWTGLLMLITLGGFGIWVLIDIIIIASCAFKDGKGRTLEFVKSSGSLVKRVILILLAIFLGFILFASLLISLVFYATKNVVATVNEQLAALQAGDIDRAYSYTSKEFQKNTPMDKFKIFLAKAPMLQKHKDVSIPARKIENDTGEVKAEVVGDDNKTYTVNYKLVYEDGHWKIININVILLPLASDKK
jgi:TM2 domain-containing membrane protein YozV